MSVLLSGPQAQALAQLRERQTHILQSILATRRAQILAIGLYGSMARGSAGPFSDIEMLCVLNTDEDDYTYEWVYGPGKAEVNFQSRAVALRNASELEDDWPLTHGAYLHLKHLYGDEQMLAELTTAAQSHSPAEFNRLIAEIIVGDIYELIGKLRNARSTGQTAYLPTLAFKTVQQCALMLGLAQRTFYTTNSTLLSESLTLPDRPDGYDEVCQMVLTGDLSDSLKVAGALETLWVGIVRWAEVTGIELAGRCTDPFE